jgi:uncharacterized LabA/DUF88 family protein
MSSSLKSSQRIGIFVDVQNMFYSAKHLKQGKLDYGALLRGITGQRHLIRSIAYIVQKAGVEQIGFIEALNRFGFETKIRENKTREDGSMPHIDWNVGITVDCAALVPKLDTVVLVTGDGDFVPLVGYLVANGVRVEVYGFDRATSGDLIRSANEFISIPDTWVFKEKKFEKEQAQLQNPVYEGLPNDDELDREAMELAQSQSQV